MFAVLLSLAYAQQKFFEIEKIISDLLYRFT